MVSPSKITTQYSLPKKESVLFVVEEQANTTSQLTITIKTAISGDYSVQDVTRALLDLWTQYLISEELTDTSNETENEQEPPLPVIY